MQNPTVAYCRVQTTSGPKSALVIVRHGIPDHNTEFAGMLEVVPSDNDQFRSIQTPRFPGVFAFDAARRDFFGPDHNILWSGPRHGRTLAPDAERAARVNERPLR